MHINVLTNLGPIFDGAIDAVAYAKREGWKVTTLGNDVVHGGRWVTVAAAPNEVVLVLAWSSSGNLNCWWQRTVTR